ncbi:hypothetical protein QNO07_15380 [Streptomyces sp. 549]|uniref:hypothetical protein n=1 Tax=Streptomyces sp. 549 TaxID=3049076 RepID=UPI0024C36727|nr:hypothetical protein [Streptomyces sp. 549]MDK1474785.1 hypothetical protein [Streptomyces sp. 549]
MSAVTDGITAFSPLAVALLTGLFAARERRQSSSAKIMDRLTAEIAALSSLPDNSDAKSILLSQAEATARTYKQTCTHEDTFKRDGLGIGLGIVLGGGGIALGTWAALQGGAHMWWWALALPAIVLGVPGFFHELAGGSRETSDDEATAP